MLGVPSSDVKGELMEKRLRRRILTTLAITSHLTKKANKKILMAMIQHDSIVSMYSADADDDETGGCSQELLTFLHDTHKLDKDV
eukprot:12690017-Ditylum_brightwellii.AAC.1